MSLKRLTIIVPTYNRQKFIFRQIEFWSKLPVNLLILDGSKEPCKNIKGKLSKKIIYYHAPISIEQRLKNSLDFISTDYVAMISDDEFFLHSTLKTCVQFLDINPDFSTCKGQSIGFHWDNNKVLGRLVYQGLKGYIVKNNKSNDRIKEHLFNYQMATLWSVQRKKVFESCIKVISNYSTISSAAAIELGISIVSAYMGKIKVVDDLMWLRSYENKNIWWSSGRIRIPEWWKDKTKKKEHKLFINSIIYNLTDNVGEKLNEMDIRKAMDIYCSAKKEKITKFSYLLKYLMKIIKKYDKINIIKYLFYFFHHIRIKLFEKRCKPLNTLISNTHSEKKEEIDEIIKLISKFHNSK